MRDKTEVLIGALKDQIAVEGPCTLSGLLKAVVEHLEILQQEVDKHGRV